MLPFVLIAVLVMALFGLWVNARFSGTRAGLLHSARRAFRRRHSAPARKPAPHLTAPAPDTDAAAPGSTSAGQADDNADALRALQMQVRTRDSVIRRLMGSADETDAELAALRHAQTRQTEREQQQKMLLDEHKRRIDALARLEPLVDTSRAEMAALRQQLLRAEQLSINLASRDQKITNLKNRISHLTALATVLGDRLEHIQPALADLPRLQQAMLDRQAALEALEKTSRESITRFETMIAERDEQISELGHARQQVALLQSSLGEKEQTVARLESVVQELEETVTAHQDTLARLQASEETSAQLQQQLSEQQTHVCGLEAEIRERDEQLMQLQSELSNAASNEQAAAQLDELRRHLQNQETQNSQLQNELVQREQKFNQVQSQLMALARVQETLEERENTIAQQQQELERLTEIEAAQQEKDAELQELRTIAARIKASQAKAASIRSALTKAEQVAIAAEHGAVEAQRVREELHSLGRAHLKPANGADMAAHTNGQAGEATTPDETIDLTPETAQQIEARINDIERLEADTEERSRKINDLKKRLESLSRSRRNAAAGKRSTRTGRGTKPRKRELPAPLFEAPNERDDLKQIHGIGPVLEKTLNQIGVTTYRQLASFNEEDIERVTEALGIIPNRIERDDWVGGARKALARSQGAH